MNRFDESILLFLNQLSQKSAVFDHLMGFLENTNLFKGAGFIALLWAWWLQPSPEMVQRRKIILATLTGCAVSILAARLLALNLPFRPRPLNESALAFLHPLGTSRHTLETWSSFPSDHAALFSGLVVGCFFISRRAGFWAAIYASIVVIFPRLYLGFHYLTDILMGGLLGASAVWAANLRGLRKRLAAFGLGWETRFPVSFYFCFFLATYQFVVLFDDIRAGGHLAVDLVKFFRSGIWPADA